MVKKIFFVLSLMFAGLEFFSPQGVFASSSALSDQLQEERIPVFLYQSGKFLSHPTPLHRHEHKFMESRIEGHLAIVLTDESKQKPLRVAVNHSLLLDRQKSFFPSLQLFQAGLADLLAVRQELRSTSYFQEESAKLYESYGGQSKFLATFSEGATTLSSKEASEFMDASSRLLFRLHRFVSEFSRAELPASTLAMYMVFEAVHPNIRHTQLRASGRKYKTLKAPKGSNFTSDFKRLSLQESVSSEDPEAASASTH
jgi:hypothetical protein